MKETEMKQPAVITPVFDGTRYLHHICSECGGIFKFEQSCFGGAHFYGADQNTMKFCPLCGEEIIRFSDKPIYETPIDLTPLDIFADLYREYERKAKWIYFCYINDNHRDKVDELIPLVNKDDIPRSYQKAVEIAKAGKTIYSRRLTATAIKKLKKEFGEEEE